MPARKHPSSSPVGRPPKPETIDALHDKSQRATLKLCHRLRQMTELAAKGLMDRISHSNDGSISVKDHAAVVESLAKAAKLVAETEVAARKTRDPEEKAGANVDKLLGGLG